MEEETIKTILIEVPIDIYNAMAKRVKSPLVFPKQIGEEIIKEVRKNLQK